MAPDRTYRVIYWDSSAVLSVLISDLHSTHATAAARQPGIHLLSTLAFAEVFAVLARLERDRGLPAVLANTARERVRNGPWRRLTLQPDWASIDSLAMRWPLRGADLWHLAVAVTLSREMPELHLITFDARLTAASHGVGLALVR
ncbi:MAG: type II toxin-antitoxin system VapC family toxin [Candidatus Dormibacteraceae bacterium]